MNNFKTKPIKKPDALGQIWEILDNIDPLPALKRLNPIIQDIVWVHETK